MPEQDDRSMGQLVANLSQEMSTLVRSELELAKAEVTESVTKALLGGILFGAAGFFVHVAILLLSVAAALGLVELGLDPAIAFLIVAILYVLVAGVLALIGAQSVKRVGPPRRAIHELDETKKMLSREPSGSTLEHP